MIKILKQIKWILSFLKHQYRDRLGYNNKMLTPSQFMYATISNLEIKILNIDIIISELDHV